jgi:hypothetical protein
MRDYRNRRARTTPHNTTTTTPVQPLQDPAVVTGEHQSNGDGDEAGGDEAEADGDEADGDGDVVRRNLNRDAFEPNFDEWSLHQILCHIASGNPIPNDFSIEKHPHSIEANQRFTEAIFVNTSY